MIVQARRILARYEPLLARTLSDALVAAWVAGVGEVSDRLPDLALPPPPGGPPPGPAAIAGDRGEPLLRFPALEAAARDLEGRRAVTRAEFDALDQDARRAAFTVARVASADAIDKVQRALTSQALAGGTLADFEAAVEQALGASALHPAHVETVFRTNLMRAYGEGLLDTLRDPLVGGEFPYLEYVAVHDSRARKEHLEMERRGLDGTAVYRRDDPIWQDFLPPWDYNCFLPETEVEGKFLAGFRSWYAGKGIQITTRSGKRLRVTANHPVLTSKGFSPAYAISKGADVLSYSRWVKDRLDSVGCGKSVVGISRPNESWLSSPGENKHNGPAVIEKVFGALYDLTVSGRVPVGADDFHGDAKCGNGYVDVVGPLWQLWIDSQPDFLKCRSEFFLAAMDEPKPFVASPCPGRLACHAAGLASDSIPRGGALLDSRLPVHSRPFKAFSFGSAANLDASVHKCRLESSPADVQLVSQLLHGFASEVSLDEVVEVVEFEFSGHVYDLQSVTGWVVANGIFCSNCRCSVIPLSLEDAAAKGVLEARRWLETGEPPGRPQWVDRPPFGPPAGWQRNRLEAYV